MQLSSEALPEERPFFATGFYLSSGWFWKGEEKVQELTAYKQSRHKASGQDVVIHMSSNIVQSLKSSEVKTIRALLQQAVAGLGRHWVGAGFVLCSGSSLAGSWGKGAAASPRELCLGAWQFGRGLLPDKPCSFPMPHA